MNNGVFFGVIAALCFVGVALSLIRVFRLYIIQIMRGKKHGLNFLCNVTNYYSFLREASADELNALDYLSNANELVISKHYGDWLTTLTSVTRRQTIPAFFCNSNRNRGRMPETGYRHPGEPQER